MSIDINSKSEVRKRRIKIDIICCYCKKIVELRHKCKCDKKDCTGYLCDKCYNNYSPDSSNNLLKYINNWRNENLSRYSAVGKGLIGQWIAAKTLGIKDLNIENKNLRQPIDLYHSIYHNLDIKISTFDNKRGVWFIRTGDNHNFDQIIALCMDQYKPWKKVERVYFIPINSLKCIATIGIVKNPIRSVWYERFRTDENAFNKTYNTVDIPELFSPFCLWEGKYDKASK